VIARRIAAVDGEVMGGVGRERHYITIFVLCEPGDDADEPEVGRTLYRGSARDGSRLTNMGSPGQRTGRVRWVGMEDLGPTQTRGGARDGDAIGQHPRGNAEWGGVPEEELVKWCI